MPTFTGTDGNDVISGSDGADDITTGKGIDTVLAGGGNDVIYSESAGGSIDGGSGFDVYTGNLKANTAALTVDIGSTIQVSIGLTVTNVENIVMGDGQGDDVFNVTKHYDGTLYGGAGSDTLNYSGGAATAGMIFTVNALAGGSRFSGGIDSLSYQDFERLAFVGGSLNDRFQIGGGFDPARISIDGAGGNDTVTLDLRFASGATNFVVNPDGTTSANRGNFTNIENFFVSAGDLNDIVVTGAGDDVLGGYGGDDDLQGGAGNDTLIGHAGSDTLRGGSGNDRLYGDDSNSRSADTLDGGTGDDEYLQVDGLDIIIEFEGAGYDRVEALVDYVLPENVEALSLMAAPSFLATGPIAGTGNGLANTITGNELNNVLLGLGGNDTIIGGYGSDTITGGEGVDTLTGGHAAGSDLFADGSADTFRDTVAGLNGDTITDFSLGDRIVITDAALADFSFRLDGNTLTFTGGSIALANVPAGRIVASAANGGGVQLTLHSSPFVAARAGDFNGDGRADILWRSDSGDLSTWLASSGNNNFAPAWGTAIPVDWRIAFIGDFNGDHRSDLIWRHDNGSVATWLGAANGGFSPAWGTSVATDWKIAGTGDFNGDGRDDVLWRSDSGAMASWLGAANGGFTPAWGTNVATDWTVAGTGDFNGDGRDDILWRSADGAVANWLGAANGGFTPVWGTTTSSEWRILGTGDFNGDGRSDILWRVDAWTVSIWTGSSNGGFTSVWGTTAPMSAASIGDFNGDGRDDVLWQDAAGRISQWIGHQSGGLVDLSYPTFAAPLGWHVQDALL